jgi:hypothetical protein
MAGPDILIASPPRKPRVGGIGSIASFRLNGRLGIAQSLIFQSDACTFPQVSEHLCYVGEESPTDKAFDGIVIADAIGTPFPLYAGVKCWAGPDPDELERANEILTEGRDRALEEQLAIWANQGTIVPGGGTGGTVTGAIALIEQELDDNYIGQGVILMSRADAVRGDAEGSLHVSNGLITTINGTPVIASGRVAPGQAFGLGAIVVEHGGAESRQVVRPTFNEIWALAEEIYALAVDCEFRVRASTTASAPPAAPAITAFTSSGTFTAASTTVAFTITETGASPIANTLQYQDRTSGAWTDVEDDPSIAGSVYTWDFDVEDLGFVATDIVHFRLVANNIAGSATSSTVNRTVAAAP